MSTGKHRFLPDSSVICGNIQNRKLPLLCAHDIISNAMSENKYENRNSSAPDQEEENTAFSETQVFEALTDEGRLKRNEEGNLSETRAMETMTDPVPAVKTEKAEPEQKGNSALKEILLFARDLVICMSIVLVLVNYVIRPVQVKGTSMYPTLKDKAIGLSNLLGYNMDGINRFDIVIIYIEEKDEYLVKRAVGLPGETLSYHNGILQINGEPVDEPFLNSEYRDSYEGTFMRDVSEITLAEDEYFCLGDNRPASSDSRVYGPFKKDHIISKGIFILFPFTEFGVKTWW